MAQGVEQAQPPVLPLTGGGGVVKDELPARQQRDLFAGEGGQIRLEPPAIGLISAEQHHTASGHCPDGGGDVGAVDAGETRDGTGNGPPPPGPSAR